MTNPFRVVVVLCLAFCCRAGHAQLFGEKRIGNRTVQCMHSGLSSDLQDCGLHSDWYAYVFVGTISGIKPIEQHEMELQITPEEIFNGEPANPLTIRTSQGECLEEFRKGDEWLFFLRKADPIVLDYYGNISAPLARSQDRLETLRRLQSIGDNGILRGGVRRGAWGAGNPVPNARVIARHESDNTRFMATTDSDGRYEFQPLAPGKYKITVDPVGSFQPDDSRADISPHACWDLTLSRSPHAEISGRVRRADGSAAAEVTVLRIWPDDSGWDFATTDASGFFHFDSVQEGKYVIGIRLPDLPGLESGGCGGACKDQIPDASLYYPEATSRNAATIVDLAVDEKRGDIDFILPKK